MQLKGYLKCIKKYVFLSVEFHIARNDCNVTITYGQSGHPYKHGSPTFVAYIATPLLVAIGTMNGKESRPSRGSVLKLPC
jgi:hypothetical protein